MEAILHHLKDIFEFFKKFAKEQEYIVSFEQANPAQGNTITSDCNTIGLKNVGTSVVWINNVYPIYPQDSFIIDGNQREKDVTVYNYYFNHDVPGTTDKLVIVRKTLKK